MRLEKLINEGLFNNKKRQALIESIPEIRELEFTKHQHQTFELCPSWIERLEQKGINETLFKKRQQLVATIHRKIDESDLTEKDKENLKKRYS
jgi:hypothetical protein